MPNLNQIPTKAETKKQPKEHISPQENNLEKNIKEETRELRNEFYNKFTKYPEDKDLSNSSELNQFLNKISSMEYSHRLVALGEKYGDEVSGIAKFKEEYLIIRCRYNAGNNIKYEFGSTKGFQKKWNEKCKVLERDGDCIDEDGQVGDITTIAYQNYNELNHDWAYKLYPPVRSTLAHNSVEEPIDYTARKRSK